MSRKKHIGPNRKIVSLYLDANWHERMKEQARVRRMSLSHWLRELAIADIERAGDKKAGTFKGTQLLLAELEHELVA